MGQLKKHIANDVILAGIFSKAYSNAGIPISTTIKNIAGTSKSAVGSVQETTFLRAYNFLFYASSQELSSYDYNEGDISALTVGNISVTKTQLENHHQAQFDITVSNSGSDSITVNSIKVCAGAGSNNTDVYLMYTYYLSAPVTIPAGESAYIHLIFDYSQPAPTVAQG